MKRNAAGEKEMRAHIKDVKQARGQLKHEADELRSKIGSKITGALKQDRRVLKDMQKVDRKK